MDIIVPDGKSQILLSNKYKFYESNQHEETIPVTVRSKPRVCGYWRAGVVGSNPTGVMDVCYQVEVTASG